MTLIIDVINIQQSPIKTPPLMLHLILIILILFQILIQIVNLIWIFQILENIDFHFKLNFYKITFFTNGFHYYKCCFYNKFKDISISTYIVFELEFIQLDVFQFFFLLINGFCIFGSWTKDNQNGHMVFVKLFKSRFLFHFILN